MRHEYPPKQTRRAAIKAGAMLVGGAFAGTGLLRPDSAQAAPAQQRPLADFLDTQGTTTFFVPPVPDYVGWSTPFSSLPARFALIDYAGLADEFIQAHTGGFSLGTTVDGSILERPLASGRAEVTVVLHTTRALAWVVPIAIPDPSEIALNALLFGYRAQDIVANTSLTPGLAECHLVLTFQNTAPGAPLPDLVPTFFAGSPGPGQALVAVSFHSRASGPLRPPFGVPDGTPGSCVVSQNGVLLRGHFKGATADGFPVEHVDLHPVGQ
jgi:hypothetical protein